MITEKKNPFTFRTLSIYLSDSHFWLISFNLKPGHIDYFRTPGIFLFHVFDCVQLRPGHIDYFRTLTPQLTLPISHAFVFVGESSLYHCFVVGWAVGKLFARATRVYHVRKSVNIGNQYKKKITLSCISMRFDVSFRKKHRLAPELHFFNMYLINPSTMSRMWHKVNF